MRTSGLRVWVPSMNDFVIDFEWIDPLGAKGDELRATWARLSIAVDGCPVTRVLDERSRTVRDSVYVPLYPLAEWLAGRWWALWNEPGRPAGETSDYCDRHSLIAAREGYALPRLLIRPTGSQVMLTWCPDRLEFHGLEFTAGNSCRLNTSVVRQEFSNLVDAVTGRLDAFGVKNTLLQQDWEAIQTADNEEREFCEYAGALGLDPYAMEDYQRQAIVAAAQRLPHDLLPEFFRAAAVADLLEETQRLHEALEESYSNTQYLSALIDLRRTAQGWTGLPGEMPWNQGYAFARRLREHLGLDGRVLKSLADIADAVGSTEEGLFRAIGSFGAFRTSFPALMGTNERNSPVFVLRKSLETQQRFHFCRALFEYLAFPNRQNALISEVDTEVQKRNRAFAAEFLAPSTVLMERFTGPIATLEEIEEVAVEFHVSAYIIRHQLRNHHIADVQDDRDV